MSDLQLDTTTSGPADTKSNDSWTRFREDTDGVLHWSSPKKWWYQRNKCSERTLMSRYSPHPHKQIVDQNKYIAFFLIRMIHDIIISSCNFPSCKYFLCHSVVTHFGSCAWIFNKHRANFYRRKIWSCFNNIQIAI